MKDAVAALEIIMRDLPEIDILEELHVITFNQTYWTGWPSAEDPYAAPYPPFEFVQPHHPQPEAGRLSAGAGGGRSAAARP